MRPAELPQEQAVPEMKLFDAVDRGHSQTGRKPQRRDELARQMPLSGHQGDGFDQSAAAFDGRLQGGQQRRFAGAVASGDLALPGVGFQGIDKLLETLPLFEDEVDRARPQPRGTEGVAHDRGWGGWCETLV